MGGGEPQSTGATCLLCRGILQGAGVDTAARKPCVDSKQQSRKMLTALKDGGIAKLIGDCWRDVTDPPS